MPVRIAIVSRDTLQALGLKSLIEEIIPGVEVVLFATAEALPRCGDEAAEYVHYFVSAEALAGDVRFFLDRARQTIVLTAAERQCPQSAAFHTLDPSLPERELARAVLRLRDSGHGRHPGGAHSAALVEGGAARSQGGESMAGQRCGGGAALPISQREADVLSLVVRGCINKEIADRLCISPTTVITHRRNICDKLGLRSVSALTIYAVTHGVVSVDDI